MEAALHEMEVGEGNGSLSVMATLRSTSEKENLMALLELLQ
jgi:hypothetical protein